MLDQLPLASSTVDSHINRFVHLSHPRTSSVAHVPRATVERLLDLLSGATRLAPRASYPHSLLPVGESRLYRSKRPSRQVMLTHFDHGWRIDVSRHIYITTTSDRVIHLLLNDLVDNG